MFWHANYKTKYSDLQVFLPKPYSKTKMFGYLFISPLNTETDALKKILLLTFLTYHFFLLGIDVNKLQNIKCFSICEKQIKGREKKQ